MLVSPWQCLALSSLLGHAAGIPASRGHQGNAPAFAPRQDGDPFQVALEYTSAAPGTAVKPGTKLRILCIGDSITVGQGSSHGNGFRARLRENLSGDQVVFAGTVQGGAMTDGYFAAWAGKTIKYMTDNMGPSLQQRPNIVLVHAGTNDMSPNPDVAKEGDEVGAATERLGSLIDQIFAACPDAVVLVAMIIDSCRDNQDLKIDQFQALVPGIVNLRRTAGKHAIAVNFTSVSTSLIPDCIHPSDQGYRVMGDYWFDFMTQIPKAWITAPVGPDPNRTDGIEANGGLDQNIPPLDWGTSPVQTISQSHVLTAASAVMLDDPPWICNSNPHWHSTGRIAGGRGHMGGWQFTRNWQGAGQLAPGIGRDPRYVRLVDMNGDGKADYVWLDPDTGMILCWINNLPNAWTPAGNNGGLLASGRGPAAGVQLADLNGDGRADYIVINPETGAIRVWWNYGPDSGWSNGWKFVEAGQIARGVPHANWKTLRFPDINGDGRADYVYIGAGGSLNHWLNTGSAGGEDVVFVAQGGITSGDAPDVDHLVFADIDGDGRDDYLVWDAQAGLTGYLNQRTQSEGVPKYISQGPAKTIATGINQPFSEIRLADMDGDGKADYVHVGVNGTLSVWYNRGSADTTVTMDGLRFADIDGDGLDDYVWLHPDTGAPTVYINKGLVDDRTEPLGWLWTPLNGGEPIASGRGRAATVQFGDINGDGKDDYLVLDPKTGALKVWLNAGPDDNFASGWRFDDIGQIASGLGRGDHVRFADIDGDGFDDYIFLKPNGGTVIYRNIWDPQTPRPAVWTPMPEADAPGINQRPEEISFHDVNGDGRADYIWTSAATGKARVWVNNYPAVPMWLDKGEIASGVGTSGNAVRWAALLHSGREDYVAVNPHTGAIAAWLNGCDNLGPRPRKVFHGGPDTCRLISYQQGSSSVSYPSGQQGVFLSDGSSGLIAYLNGQKTWSCENSDDDNCNPRDVHGTFLEADDTGLKWDVLYAPASADPFEFDCVCFVNDVEVNGQTSGDIFTGFFYNSETNKCACEYSC